MHTASNLRLALVSFTVFALMAAVPAAQQAPAQPPPSRAAGTVKATTTAIMVDVVVRDRQGNPVTDLLASDFELIEDGTPQQVGSVTFYGSPNTAPAKTAAPAQASATVSAAAARPATVPAPPPVIALVFDRLSPDARVLANKAALGYIGKQPDAVVGVFGIDLSLITYQTYTRDAAALKKALDDLGQRSSSQFSTNAQQSREAGAKAAGAASAAGNFQSAVSAGGPGAAQAAAGGGGAAAAEAQMAEMQRRMLETFEVLERDQQGYATSNGLLALINSMRALPGRKSVVFFSEGLAIPPAVAAHFRSVIDTANRANVSIYAMDAAGLRTESTQRETRDNLMAASDRSLQRNPSSDVTGAAMTAALERNEDLLRADPHSGLGQLTSETGGFLVRNTNDLGNGFRRVDEDMRNYYMLTYVPSNEQFDGKFRTIEVKVKRSGVDIAARKGYFAVRTPGAQPVMTFEAPALAMLEATPVPNAFPVRAAAMKFPEPSRPGLVPVVVTTSAANMTYVPTEDQKSYRADFTVLVRFRDTANQVVHKMSQHYELNAPAENLESVKQGEVLFFRQPELPPGVYTMETIVFDALGTRASVRFSTVEQPQADVTALRMSNLMLIRRGERLPAQDRLMDNPFRVGDLLLYPNLGEPLRKSADQELAFFFTVYQKTGAKPATAMLELMQNGKPLARSPLELSKPDDTGRIQQVSRLPLTELAPGTYDLRVVVTDGTAQQARSVMVRIVN